jgi:hypothetical protein
MGTNLQEVFDAFFAKIPSVDFSGKESLIVQYLKSAIGKCYRQVYDDLTYIYDEYLKTGYFNNVVSQPSIDLISMYMVKEYLEPKYALLCARKQYLGTQAFNKITSGKDELEILQQSILYWTDEIDRLLKDLPDYSNER